MPWPRTYAVEKYTPRTWRMVVLAAATWIALTLCAWWVSHGWGIFFAVAGFHFLLLGFLTGKPRRRYMQWVVILLVIAILFHLSRGNVDYIRAAELDTGVRIKVREIGQRLKRDSLDTGGRYPVLLEQWTGDYAEYLADLRNPYSSQKMLYLHFREGGGWPADAPAGAVARNIITDEYINQDELDAMGRMRHVAMSDPEHAGNFTYIPHLERDEAGEVICTGFILVGYGLAMYGDDRYREHLYGGNAWEHVVFVTGDREPVTGTPERRLPGCRFWNSKYELNEYWLASCVTHAGVNPALHGVVGETHLSPDFHS